MIQRQSPARRQDPFAEREAARYDNPVASRELILEVLGAADGPLSRRQLCEQLHIEDDGEAEALRRRLRAMERDGQLLVNRRGAYGLVDKLDLVRGRVLGHRDGYGFLVPAEGGGKEGGGDLYLSARQMALVFDGDEALAMVSGVDHRGRKEGKIVEVLQRGCTEVAGRYHEESGFSMVIPDNARVNHDILIPPANRGGAKHGQIVVAEITSWPARHIGATGRVIEVLGEHLDPGMEIEIAIRSHGIPALWPEDALREAAALEPEPLDDDKRGRIDLRALAFVTIDGEDAQDFDDAVYCEERAGGGWRLWVAIADVGHYVRPGSALDKEALNRGNSVYFPGRVVPMLPEALSNGLCSLMPAVDRLAMACEMDFSSSGEMERFQFCEAVIHSRARLTYTQVGAVLEGSGGDAGADERTDAGGKASANGNAGAGAGGKERAGAGASASENIAAEIDPAIIPHLQRLHSLSLKLRQAREQRGAIDFETVETRILFDKRRKIEAILPVHRNDAHKLIEECMLCANVAAARFFEACELPTLYRVHEGPTADKLKDLRSFLGELGLDLRGGKKPTPEHYQQLLQQVAGRPDAHIIQTMLLRSLSQAAYQPDNQGHFGLHYDAYAHFTSPIRRYPDLLVHRGLRQVIRGGKDNPHVQRRGAAAEKASAAGKEQDAARIHPYDEAAMAAMGAQCSSAERRADDATREVEAWLKCEYLQGRVGEAFDAVVATVTGFGLFVELSGIYIEGLVHISALPQDYYHYDHARQRLVGERSGRSFNLGDDVRVQVARVDLDDRKIDLELLEPGAGSNKERGGNGGAEQAARRGRHGRRAPGARGGERRGGRGERRTGGRRGAAGRRR